MRYGDILPDGFFIPSSAFWLKKDLTVTNPFKLVDIRLGDVMMDCGAYIGTFAAACMEQGAAAVVCYEAAPKNAKLLRLNMVRYGSRATIIEGAITATDEEYATLTMSSFSGANSLLPSKNRPRTIKVKSYNFRQAVINVEPTVLKIDVESAEYDLMDSLSRKDLDTVRCLFIEFHPIENREVRIERIVRYITSEGFTIINTRKRAFIALRKKKS